MAIPKINFGMDLKTITLALYTHGKQKQTMGIDGELVESLLGKKFVGNEIYRESNFFVKLFIVVDSSMLNSVFFY